MCIQFSTYLLTYRKSNLCLFSILKKGNLKDVSLNNQLVGQPINFKDLGKNEKSRSSPSCNTSASPLYRNLNNKKKKFWLCLRLLRCLTIILFHLWQTEPNQDFPPLASAIMDNFLKGITPLRYWYINPNEKSNK